MFQLKGAVTATLNGWRRVIPIAVVLLVTGTSLALENLDAFAQLNRLWLDAQFLGLQSRVAESPRLDPVIIGLDQAFLDSIDEPLALVHRQLAQTLDALTLAGPQVVGIDLVMPNKRFDHLVPIDAPSQDYHRTLLESLFQLGQVAPIVLATAWNADRARFEDIHVDFQSAAALLAEGGTRFSSTMLCLDRDQRVRRIPGYWCQPAHETGFAAAVAELAAGNSLSRSDGLIHYALGPPLEYLPINRVRALAEAKDIAELKRLLQGRAVFIGAVFENQDIHDVPVALEAWRPGHTDVHGVSVHAQIYRTLVLGRAITPLDRPYLAIPMLAGALFWLGAMRRAKAAGLVLFCVAAMGLSWLLFGVGYWLAPVGIVAAGLIAFGARAALDAWGHYETKRNLQRSFNGYVSPAVMDEITSGRLAVRKTERRHIAVLFSDIRNFTTLSEKSTPDAVAALLTRYFDCMTQTIHRQGGTLDKFIGDGIMALFGAPNELENPEASALRCARDMLHALASLNQELQHEGWPALEIGIGVHSGDAIVGHIGGAERHAYSAIGDTVNIAARLEALCKTTGRQLMCSHFVWTRAGGPDDFEDFGERPLKGHSAVRTFALRVVNLSETAPKENH